MELKNVFKIAPLALIIVGITMFAMHQPTQPVAKIKILTSDDQTVEIPRNIALKSSVIKANIEDLGESDATIPLPNVSKAQLKPIVSVLQNLDTADQSYIKREDGGYIAQRIQPIIDGIIKLYSTSEIVGLIHTAEYLDLGYLINGMARLYVQKKLVIDPDIEPTIMATEFASTLNLDINKSELMKKLKDIFEYQYQLVKNGNIPELSIGDYIAINGMPTIEKDLIGNMLNLGYKKLTSIEGLTFISDLANLNYLDLSQNQLTNIAVGTFNGLTNLKVINMSGNKLTTIAIDTFKGLTNLKSIYLNKNQLTYIAMGTFNDLTNLWRIDLSGNKLTYIEVGTFKDLTNLGFIDMSSNPITKRMPKGVFIRRQNIHARVEVQWSNLD